MTIFNGVPSSFWGESFSSWLVRLTQEKFMNERALQTCFVEHAACVGGDLDLLSTVSAFIEELPSSIANEIRYVFSTPDLPLAPFNRSNLYCPRCIQCDVENCRTPGWRLAWRAHGACVCLHHDEPVLLRRLENARYNVFNRSWLAFGEFVASPAAHLSVDFALMGSAYTNPITRNRILLHLTARVQRWYQNRVALGLEGRLLPAAARFLLYLWLWENERASEVAGFARLYIQQLRGKSLVSSPRAGKAFDTIYAMAPVRHLAVAYWLLGIAYGVINEYEAQFIKAVIRSDSLEFPTNRSELNLKGLIVFNKETLEVIRGEAVAKLDALELQQISWALF